MSEGKRILIIGDDDLLATLLSEQLAGLGGYACTTAQDGRTGLDAAVSSHFDLVLLDVDLSGGDAIDLCGSLRARGVMAPIVMVTADESEDATIAGLDAGATDYVIKPFKIGVLLARIRAHIRQFEHSEDAVLAIGPFAFRPGAKTLTPTDGDGHGTSRPVRLTDKEAQILKFLYMHASAPGPGNGGAPSDGTDGGVVSREDLLGEVWGYNAGVTTHTLETHVYRLRQKMETDPSHAELLLTAPGGYRLKI